MNTTAIRIEHPHDGQGIFNSMFNGENRLDSMRIHDNLCTVHRAMRGLYEILNEIRPEDSWELYYCAYSSLEELGKWIRKEWWDEIIENGFRVYTLTLSTAYTIENQVIFKRSAVLDKMDVTDLFKNVDNSLVIKFAQ